MALDLLSLFYFRSYDSLCMERRLSQLQFFYCSEEALRMEKSKETQTEKNASQVGKHEREKRRQRFVCASEEKREEISSEESWQSKSFLITFQIHFCYAAEVFFLPPSFRTSCEERKPDSNKWMSQIRDNHSKLALC